MRRPALVFVLVWLVAGHALGQVDAAEGGRGGYTAAADLQTLERLDRRIRGVALQEVRLADVLADLARQAGTEFDVRWSDLARLDLGRDTPVTLRTDNASIRAVLDTIGHVLTPSEPMAWYITEGRVVITPQQQAHLHRVEQVYPRLSPTLARALPRLLPRTAVRSTSDWLRVTAPPDSQARMQRLAALDARPMRPEDWDAMLEALRPLHQATLSFEVDNRPAGATMQALGRARGVTVLLDERGLQAHDIDLSRPIRVRGEQVTAWEALGMMIQAAAGDGEIVADPVPDSRILIITPAARARRRVAGFTLSQDALEQLGAADDPAAQAARLAGTLIQVARVDPGRGEGFVLLQASASVGGIQTVDRLLKIGHLLGDEALAQALATAPEDRPAAAGPRAQPDVPEATAPQQPGPRPSADDEAAAMQRLQIAETQLRMRLFGRAIEMYQQVIDQYPGTSAADAASERIRELRDAGH